MRTCNILPDSGQSVLSPLAPILQIAGEHTTECGVGNDGTTKHVVGSEVTTEHVNGGEDELVPG